MPTGELEVCRWNYARAELLHFGYHVDDVLGHGSWGTVVKAHQIAGKKTKSVAIKVIDRRRLCLESWRALEREVDSMTLLDDHENVIQLINVLETLNFVYLVLEFCPKGDLLDFVQKSKTGLKEAQARRIFKQMVEATNHAHKNGYVHRDIKLENIFMTQDGSVKLGDWGFARKVTGEKLTEYCGSVHYCAPEITRGTPYDGFAVDVWSLGVSLYAMTTGRLPFWGTREQDVVGRIQAGAYKMVDTFSETLKDLISSALTIDPKKRITIEQMLAHPWMQGLPFKPLPLVRTSDSQEDRCSSEPMRKKLSHEHRRASVAALVPRLELERLVVVPNPATAEDLSANAQKTTPFTDVPLLTRKKSPTLSQTHVAEIRRKPQKQGGTGWHLRRWTTLGIFVTKRATFRPDVRQTTPDSKEVGVKR